MREFNVTGLCVSDEHYMVDTSEKLSQIKQLIDKGKYFTINRARQYGKTTTLNLLRRLLFREYICVMLSFEGLGTDFCQSSEAFCSIFAELIGEALQFSSATETFTRRWNEYKPNDFKQLSKQITNLCQNHQLVLMIDEVDKASNNEVFLSFLGMLREFVNILMKNWQKIGLLRALKWRLSS